MSKDPKFIKWCNWLTTINEGIMDLFAAREIFQTTAEIINSNEKINKDLIFLGFLLNTFIDLVVMGIRRQIKVDEESISMANILSEIVENPELISRKTISKEEVLKDLQSLRDICKTVEDYADRRIAHYDKRPPRYELSIPEIYSAIEAIGELGKKYSNLLLAISIEYKFHPMKPVYDVFEIPWITRKIN